MKRLLSILLFTSLVGCNSSSNDNASQQIPPTHLPESSVPERPTPDVDYPEHLPGDMVPDRLPIDWYGEASSRYGMTIEDLDAVCRYNNFHPQLAIHISCLWDNEQLTIIYYVSRHTSEPELLFEHSFIWVINDARIDHGLIWPMTNHTATGLEGRNLRVSYDDVSLNIRTGCEAGECTIINHVLTHLTEDNRILSNGIPYNYTTDFVMDSYQESERFYYRANFTDRENGETFNNTLHLHDDFPRLMHKVLAPAFGY
ncbi:hypothetical protein VIN01S_35710 [Vibrio inusitatus NBRC 102082]|uniref:Lipoprotein n=1 Tax=Vibrio inusitatus NBRC 102082 TaxID=1219070 RepID=A0A4Y3I025_9VIBR|nr:hypothetical protein [Vibrio inusitatus]GEA52767.1 hypothetical protein VIN01S_35710 [Vibrio inusitatus NBRC 102082]